MDPTRPSTPAGPERRPGNGGVPPLEIHRSHRRRRSAQANARDGVIVVRLPAGLAAAEEEAMITRLVGRIARSLDTDALGGDAALAARADVLADRYLDGVRATSVRWSTRMARRYGSCSVASGRIRIADQLAGAPRYVLDAVLVHELAHLQVADHSEAFWELAHRYPQQQRAIGYLEGFTAGRLEAAAAAAVADRDHAGPDVDAGADDRGADGAVV